MGCNKFSTKAIFHFYVLNLQKWASLQILYSKTLLKGSDISNQSTWWTSFYCRRTATHAHTHYIKKSKDTVKTQKSGSFPLFIFALANYIKSTKCLMLQKSLMFSKCQIKYSPKILAKQMGLNKVHDLLWKDHW